MEKDHYEVIIIGGGIMGSVTAYYLSKYLGNDVLMLEQYDLLHRRGSSHGDSRYFEICLHTEYDKPSIIENYLRY